MSRCEQIKRLQSGNKWMSFIRVIDLFLSNSLQKHSQGTIITVTTELSDIVWIYNSFSLGCIWIFLFYRLESGLRTPETPNDQLFTSPKTDPNGVWEEFTQAFTWFKIKSQRIYIAEAESISFLMQIGPSIVLYQKQRI